MILDPTLTWAFVLAAVAITLLPGPDMLFVTAQCLRHGRRGGALAVGGIMLGLLIHALAASLGLSALFRWAPLAYEAIRWAGIAYLVWLAIQVLTSRDEPPALVDPARARSDARRIFRDAFVTNLLNPKIIVFFVAFLPQFVPPGATRPGLVMLVHALLFIAIGIAFYAAFTSLIGRIGDWLRSTPRFWTVQRWVCGSTLGGMALWLALPERR